MTRLSVAIAALVTLLPSVARSQVPDSVPGLRAPGLKRDTLRLPPLPPFVPSGLTQGPDPAAFGRQWEMALRARVAARRAARWRAALTGVSPDTLPTGLALLVPSAGLPPVRTIGRYADLGMRIDARFEMRLDRLKNLRCTAADATRLSSSCRGGFPPPRLEPQFTVRTGGVVGQRVHLNVDYDTEREFEASNNIQVYYQGLDDEILRRVQVGNVSFAAPNSQFITGGIPANNFGATAEFQLGAVNAGAIFAQQKGNVVRGRSFTIGDRTVQAQERDVMDRDFEPLRFFFVVDPAALPGYPAVNVLDLEALALPTSLRVREARVYRRRATTSGTTAEQNLGGIQAVALREDSPQRAGPLVWELLAEGRDYYLDRSGAWFALAGRLDPEDYLAVSYVTAAGDTVGTFPAAARASVVDTLRLIFEPRRAADVPTFRYEMRNAYRVGSVDDVIRETARLRILVAESERPEGGAPTFLSLLGMGQETDPSTFDQYNRLFPRQQDPGRGAPLRDLFVIFPHLTPFANAGALPAEFRNDSLYRTPTHLLRAQGPTPLFRLRLLYDAAGGDDRRLLTLGGFQIREGSERITAAGRELHRGVDYTINYEIGQVTFVNPDSLFRQPTSVSVQYEENPAFAVAPTSIYGLQAQYDLGDHGSLGMLGLLQRQRTTFTRPPLGFEPASNFVGGLTANLRFEPLALTRALDALPLVSTAAPSTLTLNAEIATSRPSPNQLGVAYVETFEDEGGAFVPLGEDLWEYGSRPSSARGVGAAGIAATGFDDADAALMVWQNFWVSGGAQVQFRAREIDPRIRLAGAGETVESILWLTLHPDTVGGLWDPDPAVLRPRWFLPHTAGPRWRTLTTPLSSTGADLSRIEFLEFWMYEDSARTARNNGVVMAFDFGTVFEDAVAFQPTGFTAAGRDTTFTGRRRAGEGRLDTERDTLTNAFNASLHDVGIHGSVADTIRQLGPDTLVRDLPLCRSELAGQLVIYPIGTDLARCTRRNGRPDTEDLNNDQHLDTLISTSGEHHFRYVFAMSDDRYYVRDGGTTAGGATWRLYRIPFRADTLQIGLADIRQVRALRVTVMAPDLGQQERPVVLGLARVKLVGAPWVKRAGSPIAGLAGATGEGHGEVVASVVSTENALDLGYTPPPGIGDVGANRGSQFEAGARQINERSLRLLGRDVRTGERAEAFVRFPEGDRNFLGYRELRVWARGRGPGWVERQLAFYIKAAQDENNFYLYRQALDTASWEPEAVVRFQRWLSLRADIEQSYLRGEPASGAAACGGDPRAYVRCDGPYLVHVRNPGVAPPNLIRVQELAVGFVRDSGAALDSAELWVDDIRLTEVVDDPGYAGAVTVHLTAADVADVDVALVRRDRNFRQLGETPSYVTTNELALGATVRLERFGLERLGLTVPLTVRTDRSSSDPYYLARTDVEAAGLEGLRRPQSRRSAIGFTLRRSRRGSAWWQRALVDNVILNGSWSGGRSTTELSHGTSRAFTGRADYQPQLPARSVSYIPGFLRTALRGLPAFLRNTEGVRGTERAALRWTPTSLSFTTELARATNDNQAFRVPIETRADTSNRSVRIASAALRSRASVDFQPFSTASVGAALVSERDLRAYDDSTVVGRVAQTRRRRVAGVDVGFERIRQLTARLSYSPNLVSWVRPRLGLSSSFALTRDPNQTAPERASGDTAGAFRLPTAFHNTRVSDLGGSIDWTAPLRALLDDSSAWRGFLGRLGRLELSERVERRSQFSRTGFDPGLSYQLGLGGPGAFREQRGVLALAAAEQRERRLSTQLQLPLGVGLSASYAAARSSLWFLRGTQHQEQRSADTDWPNVTARWLWAPRGPLARLVSSVTVSAGARRRRAETVVPALGRAEGIGAVEGSQETRSAPLSLAVVWGPRIATSITAGNERVRTVRTGNVTAGRRSQLGADASLSFRVPPAVAPLPNDVRASLRYLSSQSSSCILRAGETACIPFADSRRNEITLLLNTDLPPSASAGLSASRVVTEDIHANRKFSQFVVTATVRILFQAGELR